MGKDVMDEAATSTWLSDVLDARDPRKAIGVPEVARLAAVRRENLH